MSCDRVRKLISEGYDRRLSPAERQVVAEHVDTCDACARFEQMLRSGLSHVERLPDITPSPALWEAIHTQSALGPGVTPGRVARQAAGMLGAAVVVALVAALTVFLMHNHGELSNPNNPSRIASGAVVSPTAGAAITSSGTQVAPFSVQATTVPQVTPTTTPSIAASTAQTRRETGSATTTATPVDEKTAEDTVVGYFHAINQKDYETAYGFLGSALQAQQSFADFAQGFTGTKHDTVTITTMKPNHAGQIVVAIYLDAQQSDGSTRQYHGEYVVGNEDGRALIVDATVTEDVATPTATPDTAAKECRAEDLSVTADYQGATGSMAGAIIVTNHGTNPCVLQGTADVELLDRSGGKLAINQKTMSLDGSDKPVSLDPGQQASLFFVWSNWCPPGTAETSSAGPMAGGVTFRVTLPNDRGTLSTRAMRQGTPNTLVPRCDAPGAGSTLSVGVFKPYPGR